MKKSIQRILEGPTRAKYQMDDTIVHEARDWARVQSCDIVALQ